MRLSSTELLVLEHLAIPQEIAVLASVLGRSRQQLYRTAHSLVDKGLLERSRGILAPAKGSLPSLFIRVLHTHPQLKPLLADSGLSLLLALPGTADNLATKTSIRKSMAYKKLEEAISMSIVKKEAGVYVFNARLWPELQQLLEEIRLSAATTDPRVPAGSVIYEKNDNEILFSTTAKPDATPTAFSAYGQHGIKLLLPAHYYYLPKRPLSTKEIFVHSLHIAMQEQSTRLFLYIALFVLKHPELQTMHHAILENIKRILRGEQVALYPTRAEIAERAALYDLRLPSNS